MTGASVSKAPAKKPAAKTPAKPAPKAAPAPKAKAPAKPAAKPEAKKPEAPKPVAPAPVKIEPPKPKYPVLRPSGAKDRAARVTFPKGDQHFSDADLETFKLSLLGKRKETESKIKAIRESALHRVDEENMEEDGTSTFERGKELARAEELEKSLKAIDNALLAIKKKSYGICSMCGCLIPRDRLRAYPFAIRCKSCKEKWEKENETKRHE